MCHSKWFETKTLSQPLCVAPCYRHIWRQWYMYDLDIRENKMKPLVWSEWKLGCHYIINYLKWPRPWTWLANREYMERCHCPPFDRRSRWNWWLRRMTTTAGTKHFLFSQYLSKHRPNFHRNCCYSCHVEWQYRWANHFYWEPSF